MIRFNQALNGRLALAKSALENYGVTLWGEKISWIGNTSNLNRNYYNYVDCGYIKIVLDYGLVIGIAVIAAYIYFMYCMIEDENRMGCLLICFMLLEAFTLPTLVGLNYNPFFILLGGIFHGKTKVRQT